MSKLLRNMSNLTVCICGSRDGVLTQADLRRLSRLAAYRNWNITVVTGGSTGIDQCALDWAYANDVWAAVFPADWDKHGRAAGPIRNGVMAMYLRERASVLLVYPGGKGTADMVRQADKWGVMRLNVKHKGDL